MKKTLLSVLLCLSVVMATEYYLFIPGDSNLLINIWPEFNNRIPSAAQNWHLIGLGNRNYNGFYADMITAWDTICAPYLTGDNTYVRVGSAIHDIGGPPSTISDYVKYGDTVLRRIRDSVGSSHIIVTSYPPVGWAYSSYKDSQITIYNDSLKSIADRVLGAGQYIWDDLHAWCRSYPDSLNGILRMNPDQLHWSMPAYEAMAIRVMHILDSIWTKDPYVYTYSYSSSGIGCIDSILIPDTTNTYSYSSSGIGSDDSIHVVYSICRNLFDTNNAVIYSFSDSIDCLADTFRIRSGDSCRINAVGTVVIRKDLHIAATSKLSWGAGAKFRFSGGGTHYIYTYGASRSFPRIVWTPNEGNKVVFRSTP